MGRTLPLFAGMSFAPGNPVVLCLRVARAAAIAGLFAAALAPCQAVAPAAPGEELHFFDREVFPILESHCFKCHGAGEKLKAGFRITSREGLLNGGDLGPAVDLRDPSASLLLEMIRYTDEDHQMPPKGRLLDREIEVLAEWVARTTPSTASWRRNFTKAALRRIRRRAAASSSGEPITI